MKASGATSGPERKWDPGQQSAAPPPKGAKRSTPSANGGYPLAGPSDLPDPATHAYRGDLADVALAGRVIASHYAEPLSRVVKSDGSLYSAPDGEELAALQAGDEFRMLDCAGGWAWGYGPMGRVGYVRGDALGC